MTYSFGNLKVYNTGLLRSSPCRALEEMMMLMVTLMVTVEMLAGGGDGGNCSGVGGVVSRDDNMEGSGDLGRDGSKGEHADGPPSSQRLPFPSSGTWLPSSTLFTFIQDPGSDSRRHLSAGELERGKQHPGPQHHLGRLLQTGAHTEGKLGKGVVP